MNLQISKKLLALVALLLCIPPVWFIASQYRADIGFARMLHFGRAWAPHALPEVRAMDVPLIGWGGYDGQFYAQIAIDPLLLRSEMKAALDRPFYRSERIFVSWLAYLAGLGNARWILNAYALMPFVFWLALLGGVMVFLRPTDVRGLLCLMGVVYTTGALECVRRSLVDLPMVTLAFFAAVLVERSRLRPHGGTLGGIASENKPPILPCILMSCSILAKDISALSAWLVLGSFPDEANGWRRLAARVAVVFMPFVLWLVYLNWVFPGDMPDNTGVIGLPCVELWQKFSSEFIRFIAHPNMRKFFECFFVVSLLVQAVWFFVHREWNSPYWRMGVGFAVLFLFLNGEALLEHVLACRLVLPMSVSFNIMLMQFSGRGFVPWFVFGNIGLLGGLRNLNVGIIFG